MNNENKQETKDSGVSVIPPRTSQPFTVDVIREGLMDVAFGRMDYGELAEKLNAAAYNFYNKK